MTRRHRRSGYSKISCVLLCALVLSATVATPALSQQIVVADSSCDSFTRLASSSPDAAVRRSVPSQCAQSAATVAQLIRGARGRSEPDFLRSLLYTASFSDPAIASAATDVLGDRAASIGARLTSLTILVRQSLGRGAGVAVPDNTPIDRMTERTHCLLVNWSPPSSPAVTAGLRSAMEGIWADQGQPAPLRAFARCVRAALAPTWLPPIDISRIHLSPACREMVRVRNDLNDVVTLDWQVLNTKRHAKIDVPAAKQIVFPVDMDGVVRFTRGQQLVGEVSTGKNMCK
jgi:hypothetical protein